ncbi:MAG: hypothetical protein ABJD97_17135 [Betaproteobacteria bacterium]
MQRGKALGQQRLLSGAGGEHLRADSIGQLLGDMRLDKRSRVAVLLPHLDDALRVLLPRLLNRPHAGEALGLDRVVGRHRDQRLELRIELRAGHLVGREKLFVAGDHVAALARLHVGLQRRQLVEAADDEVRVVDPARHPQEVREERHEGRGAHQADHEGQRHVSPGDAVELGGVDGGGF